MSNHVEDLVRELIVRHFFINQKCEPSDQKNINNVQGPFFDENYAPYFLCMMTIA